MKTERLVAVPDAVRRLELPSDTLGNVVQLTQDVLKGCAVGLWIIAGLATPKATEVIDLDRGQALNVNAALPLSPLKFGRVNLHALDLSCMRRTREGLEKTSLEVGQFWIG